MPKSEKELRYMHFEIPDGGVPNDKDAFFDFIKEILQAYDDGNLSSVWSVRHS